ncbi:MAG TPA: ATP-binding protein [Tepidisphaeraceae bacterium]|nr:ATP-binding protein [Tepidisphaeraceae bacterium]
MNLTAVKTREELSDQVEKLSSQVEKLSSELTMLKDLQDSSRSDVQTSVAHVAELDMERHQRSEAERIGRVKDEFLANLSHELRTPLNAILGWAQLLKPGQTSEAEMAEGLEIIRRNALVQGQLIEDLLDMSRIVSGKLRLNVQRVDMPAVITRAVESVQLAATAKGVRLEVVVDPIAGPITGDPNRMQQVVWNLLTNAIKFTPKGGRVQIVLERASSHVELSISDTGKGIGAAFLPHVFERFSQSDPSVTRSHMGLGLGLAIVKNLVELHGGSVMAKSTGEGKGSTFIVLLPISVMRSADEKDGPTHSASPTEIEFASSPDLKGVRVMVVDDNTDTMNLVKHLLEQCGVSVATCSSGEECLARLPMWHPDVVISDIGMPDMDGYSMMREMRSLPPEKGGGTPAVALTAFARSEDRRRAMLAGFDVHVSKPVEPGELVAVVARMARRT